MKYLEYFLFGGITLSLMKYIADKSNPQYNAFLYSIPLVFLVGLYFLVCKNKKKDTINNFFLNNIFLIVLYTLFILFMYLFYNRRNSLINSMWFALIIWLILAILYVKYVYLIYLQ
jgi:cytochrome bd-type quinol oxidase subunit 2